MILDAHVHLPSSNHAKEKEESFLSYFPDRASAVAYLRRTGIGGVVFTTWEGVWSDTEEELENANAEALEIYESDRGFFYPGASIHPAYPKTSEKWLSLFREKGLVWVGELVHYRAGQGDYDNAEWIRLFELCCEYGMIVQLHFSPSVIRLAKRLPSLRIVNSHIDVPHLRALAECPNVLLDVSGFAGGLRFNAMESARIAFGPDRILFGTDFTVYEPEAFLLRSRHAFPDPEEQKKLYSGNLLSLLKSAGAGRVFYSGEQTCMQ